MRKFGFTLAELLAVISILGAILLIATPMVIRLIKSSKNSASLRSAEQYLEAAELALINEKFNNKLGNVDCTVLSNGNLNCGGRLVEVEVEKDTATGGTITFTNGEISNVFALVIDDKTYNLLDGEIAQVTIRNLTVNTTNATTTAPEYLVDGTDQVLTFEVDEGYILPFDVEVSGANYTYNRDRGTLTLSNFSGNVTVNFAGRSFSMPSKGTVITMDINPNYDSTETYKVISVDGDNATLLSMYDLTTLAYNETSSTGAFGSTTGQRYESSTLDTYLNTTWYNQLSVEAKSAIVETSIVQDLWNSSNSGSPYYTTDSGTSRYCCVQMIGGGCSAYCDNTVYYYVSKLSSTLSVGNRKVYAPSLSDVGTYLNLSNGATFPATNAKNMFWTSTGSLSILLRSATSSATTSVRCISTSGGVSDCTATSRYAVRAMFKINLKKVDWS